MRKTIIDYYMGGHGPTVYIGVKTMAWLFYLRGIMMKLKENTIDSVDFHLLDNIEINGINTFYLVKSSKHLSPCITINYSKKNGSSIVWSISEEKLDYTLHILSCLIESDSSGHQHLDEDEVLIELSYKEGIDQ